jgi:hypothetical protein
MENVANYGFVKVVQVVNGTVVGTVITDVNGNAMLPYIIL